MAGKQIDTILDQLFAFGKEIMQRHKIYPFVSFVVKQEVIVARGYNQERERRDITLEDFVVAIRNAQEAQDTGDLSGHTLVSFFEPTILGFDVALWSGIRDFIWCVNSTSLPQYYNKLHYNPLDYAKNHPGEITIQNGLREQEGLMLVKEAKAGKYYPDNLV